MSGQLPDLLGIGAEKAASTWLYMCLYEHPEICMAERKELRFFDSQRNYDQGLEAYQRWFDDCSAAKRVGEFSPTYLTSPDAPQRILSDLEDVQFVVCLRDPIERLKSHARHWLRSGKIQSRDLGKAVEEQPVLIQKSKYADALKRYLSCFEADRFHVIIYEEIPDNSETVINELYRFLGVDMSFRPNQVNAVVSQGYTPRLRSLETLKYRIHGALRHSRQGNRLVNWIRRTGLSRLYKRMNSKPADLKCRQADIDDLAKEFEAEYQEIRSLIGRDVSAWWPAYEA